MLPSDAGYKLAFITQLSEESDFENQSLSQQFHYTGPFYDGMHCKALGIAITATGTKEIKGALFQSLLSLDDNNRKK
jgi:hypothetical protein